MFFPSWRHRVYSLSDFVDVVGAVDQVIEQASGGELFVLSLRCNTVHSDTLERADQLSNSLTLKAEQIGRKS